MSKSYQEVVSDGTLRNIVLSLDYIDASDIYLRIAGEDIPKTGHETYSWVFANNIVTITPAVTTGYKVVVYRRTATTEMLNIYGQNAQFSESSMDENFTQLLYLSQEYMEQGSGTEVISECKFIRSDAYNNYYRLVLNDGSTTPEFAIPKTIAEGATVGTFAAGCTLSNVGDTALHSDGHIYGWTGTFPHTIAPGSSPTPLGAGYYVDRSDSTLRTQLSRVMQAMSPDGYFGMVNLPNIKDWGAIGDGLYHPLQEWVDSGKFSSLLAIQIVYPKATSLTQSIDQVAIQACLDSNKGRNIQAPKGRYLLTCTTVIPKGTQLFGEGKYDQWNDDRTVGVIYESYGVGNPQRWTDITGTDPADDTPMFVAGGNGVYLHNAALVSPDWSVGIMYPCVKQCGFTRLQAYGFTDGCVYLDATWSDRNTVMKALHPEIEPSTGMNEFSGDDYYIRATGAGGFAIKIQGTTRAGDSVATANDWLWGWGGTSDIRFNHGRLSASGALGGCYSHDVQLFGVTTFGQGISFDDTSFRLSGSGKYFIKLDRSRRHTFKGSYGESVGSEVGVVSITSRTQSGGKEILLDDDDLNGNYEVNGVVVGAISKSNWHTTRCISRYGADGRIANGALHMVNGPNNSMPLQITSFHNSGLGSIGWDDGSARIPLLQFGPGFLRPETALGATLGTTKFPWSKVETVKVNSNADLDIVAGTNLNLTGQSVNNTFVFGNAATPVIRPITDGFASLGTTTFQWLHVRAHNLYSDSGAVQVSDINYKTDIASFSDEVLDAWGDVNYCQFRMIAGTRLHAGTIVQWILDAFSNRGLDATEYGIVCYDSWPAKAAIDAVYTQDGTLVSPAVPAQAAGEQWTLRWNECAAFEAAYQRRRADRMEARLLALEAKVGS